MNLIAAAFLSLLLFQENILESNQAPPTSPTPESITTVPVTELNTRHTNFSKDTLTILLELQENIKVFERTNNQKLIPQEIEIASVLTNGTITNQEQLNTYVQNLKPKFTNFLNIVWVAASILIALGLTGVLYFAFGAQFLEFVGYITSVLGIFSGAIFPEFGVWFVAPACLLLGALLCFSTTVRQNGFKNVEKLFSINFGVLTLVYGACAMFYNSEFLGFITVMALETFLGFSVFVAPLCVGLGFNSDKAIPRATTASFLILASFILTKITQGDLGPFKVFESGALFIGSLVYFIGLIIMASCYYKHGNYILRQFLIIASGIAAFYIGATFEINALLGIGGTVFVIYLLEKYSELPWKDIGYAWAALGLGVILFTVSFVVYKYPINLF